MKNILILYASATGMTLDVATRLHQRLVTDLPDRQFTLADVRDTATSALTQYDGVLFGTSSWDHGIPCPDGEVFMENIVRERPDLTGLPMALFGLGDSAYTEFCGALPLVQQDFERCGAKVDPTHFTIDGFANEQTMTELASWATKFIESHQGA